jgi:hypothetical protein
MTVLQQSWPDKVVSGDWMGALFDPILALVPLAVLVTIVGGVVTAALWSWSNSWVLTSTWLALFSGVILARAPPTVAAIGYVALAFAVAIGLYGVVTGE